MIRCLFAAVLLAMLSSASSPATAAEFFAAADGKANGAGSKDRPWDLRTALSAAAIRPGDTLWLRGGTYRGDFTSRLTGTADAPITVRQYPGERAIIDLVTEERTAL